MVAGPLAHFAALALGLELPTDLSHTLEMIWSLVLGWPFIPLLVRRLHDQNRSGIWALIWVVEILCSTVLLLQPERVGGSGPSISFLGFHRWIAWGPVTIPLMAMDVIASIAMLVLYLRPGTPGDNRYGPDPRVAPAGETTILAAN